MFAQFGEEFQFSPPYGDGTGEWTDVDSATWFSPPYGDGTIQAKPNVPHC